MSLPPISDWALRHEVSAEALSELYDLLVSGVPSSVSEAGSSEAAAQQAIRLAAPHHGVRLWRNNVGACLDDNGNHIRYGLANESAAMNKQIKSHDLIGITQVTITPEMVGAVLGVFTSIEVKRPGWKYTGKGRELGQMKWAEIVIALGGFAQFATSPGDIWD